MRLPHYTLRAALPDIPIDLLIETLPHSLALLEALYLRLIDLHIEDVKILRIEQLLWKIVNLISSSQVHLHLRIWSKLLGTLYRMSPGVKSMLSTRRRTLERAVEGLGKHGLISSSQISGLENSTTSQNLVPLSLALKGELEARSEAYKLALQKLESCGKHTGTFKADSGVQAASHQRQLSLKYSEVQQRLIDNQSLLNNLEKTNEESLKNLIGELKCRVEHDKEALRQWTALRKSNVDTEANKNPTLAVKLLQFSRGCALALQLMNEDSTQEIHIDENLGGGDDYEEESSSAGYHTDKSCSPTPEPSITNVIARGNLSEALQNLSNLDVNVNVERLAERYGALYAHAHLHTLDALDALEPLRDAPELKAKILYSIVVLSWRVAGIIQTSRRLEAIKILNGTSSQAINTGNSSEVSSELEECIRRQLATSGAQTGIHDVTEQILSQLKRTLYDFPCLKSCLEIKTYANICSSLAWVCLARPIPLVLDVAQGVEFRRELHARHHSSPNPNGSRIRSVLWPGLRQGCQGPCLHRAIVTTI
ncbi:uncharacterized protein LOC122513097 isoform X2 [Leptopilina heterotoma]|nr:uncharacterized protein LOC122513097 isoform X2 [Leptopilina heterotoma]